MPMTGKSVRRRGRRLAGALAASAMLVLSGCAIGKASSGTGGSAQASGGGALIGVSFRTTAQQRWPFEANLITQLLAHYGDKTIVDFANDSASTQANQVQSMFLRHIKVLVISAVDSAAAAPLVAQAHNQGIKVISYDVLVPGKPDYFIGRNGVEAGVLQAQSVLKAVGCGDIAIIRGDPALINEVQASQGYAQAFQNKPACVHIVYDTTTPSWDTATAQTEAEAALQKHPDIKGFLAMWDGGAQGVIPAVKAAGKQPGQVFVTGIDASGPSLTYIAQGWQGESVWTPIDKMATAAANIAHAYASGSAVPKPNATVNGVPVDYVPLVNVEKSNLCSFVTHVVPHGWTTVSAVYGSGSNSCG